MIIAAVITVLANVMFVFTIDSFQNLTWADPSGKVFTISLDPGFLFLMALAKIIGSGFLTYKQGNSTVQLLKPILKDYKDAETGITQGVPMNESKVPQFRALVKLIMRITAAMIFILFLVCILCKNQAQQKVGNFITDLYDAKDKSNSTATPVFDMQAFASFLQNQGDELQDWMDDQGYPLEDDDEPEKEDFNYTDVFGPAGVYNHTEFIPEDQTSSSENTTDVIPEVEVDPMWEEDGKDGEGVDPEEKEEKIMRHKKDHRGGMWGKHHRKEFDFSKMSKDDALNMANMMIGFGVVFMFIYATFWILVIQAIYACYIKKIMYHQDRLEKAFMFRNSPQVANAAQQPAQP